MRNLAFTLILTSTFGFTSTASAGDAQAGKNIFNHVCAYCHNADESDKVGPGLQGINQRVTAEWLDQWLKNPKEMAKKDDYAKNIVEDNRYKLQMPTLPSMQNDEKRADVIAYLRSAF